MKIVIGGGGGFIGRGLIAELSAAGEQVILLSRGTPVGLPAGVASVRWDGETRGDWLRALDGADAVINLAGASIAGRRWTRRRKELLRSSRIEPTRLLVDAIRESVAPPGVLINASAVGYYGDVPEGDVTEGASQGSGFLADLCAEWEGVATSAERSGVRVVLLRTGVVLGKNGGALPRILLPFRFFAGGPIGDGKQWVPWIHRSDLIGIIRSAIAEGAIAGPVNATAPRPVRMEEFSRTIGLILKRPPWLPVPSLLLRAILGEMSTVLLSGQRALPSKLLRYGFKFRFPELDGALQDLL